SYATATLGAVLVVTAAVIGAAPLLFVGLFLFGGGTTANSLSRYAAVDLAPEDRRGRHLSLVVWATTLGAVAGPTLAPLAGEARAGYGSPTLSAPFAFSAGLFLVGAVVVVALMRPDPLLVARSLSASRVAGSAPDPDGRASTSASAATAPDAGARDA